MPTKLPPLLSLAGSDTDAALSAAALLGAASPWLACATLLAAADVALARGETPWALLDAAERLVTDLRLGHGCEDWHAVDWSRHEVQDVAHLDDTCRGLRMRAREIRDEALALATYQARRAG